MRLGRTSLLVPLLVAAAWLALGSCSSGTDPLGTAGGPSEDASFDATNDPQTAPMDGLGGSTGVWGCGLSDAGTWTPGKDSCWSPVSWPAPCAIEIADQPELAVPPLEWEDCPWGQPGCSKLVVGWNPPANVPVLNLTVARALGGYVAGMLRQWPASVSSPYPAVRAAIYGPNGQPMAVWRGNDPSSPSGCGPTKPLVASERAWIGASTHVEGGKTARHLSAPYTQLATATEVIDYHGAAGRMFGTNDLLAIANLTSAGTVTIYDRLSGVATRFGPPGAPHYDVPRPFGDAALLDCYFDYNPVRKQCIWTRSSNAIVPFIAPADDYIISIGTDGETLAWIQCPPGNPVVDWTGCKLWTSPWATSAAALEPALRCAAPRVNCSGGAAGEGYFATCGEDRSFHIYRLADARHWVVPFGSDLDFGSIRDVVYVDAEELWAVNSYGVVRQRLDALGEGEPCPPP